jgi:hypothetical protein
MIDVEPLIGASFDRMFPVPAVAADWNDVLRRAGAVHRRPRRRVRLALVLAALLVATVAVSPLGAGIAHSLSDFSGWLQGSPGKPASQSAQQAFDRANAKSWAGFPKGTKLRELIKTSDDGVNYTLFGVRSGESLCLRIVAEGAARGSTLSCSPLRELRARPQPALVLEVDYSIGRLKGKHAQLGPDRFTLPRASVTFGIVADNVKALHLRSDKGARDALIASNSFLSVLPRPPVGDRVHAVRATLRDGSVVKIPFAEAPFDIYQSNATHGVLHGPAKLDRVVKTGTVGWLTRRERRGVALPNGPSGSMFFSHGAAHLLFGRLIQPDPRNRMRVGLSLWMLPKPPQHMSFMKRGLYLCTSLIVGSGGGSGGCSVMTEMFARSPVNFGLTTFGGGNQYSILDGVASDDVARIAVFLGTGEVLDVPLRDNAFLTQVSRAKFPIRVVGYDNAGHVIANQFMISESGPSGPRYVPAKHAKWKQLATVTDAAGGRGELWTVPSQAGGVCWRFHGPGGGGAGGCTPPTWKGGIRGDVVPTVGPRAVLIAQTLPAVTRVVVAYKSGATDIVTPKSGFVVYAVPKGRVDALDRVTTITAFDANGAKLGAIRAAR